jgi:hypothetical protein
MGWLGGSVEWEDGRGRGDVVAEDLMGLYDLRHDLDSTNMGYRNSIP